MLELLIALFLVGICALPLAEIPMKALTEETKSAYRMQMHRLADLTYAEFKEKLYRQEISWKEISTPRNSKANFPVKSATVAFEPLGSRTFLQSADFHSVGKKGKNGEEIRLVTLKVTFKTKKKFMLFQGGKKRSAPCAFTYQTLVVKSSPTEQQPMEIAPTNPPKGQALG